MLPDADSRGPAGGHDVGDLRASLNAQLVRHRQKLRHGQVTELIKSSVADSHHFNAGSGSYNADPDRAFHLNADPDPAHQRDKNLRPMVYRLSRALLKASIVSVYGPPRLHFELQCGSGSSCQNLCGSGSATL